MQYIALLRAINVGGHTVKMDRLRDLFLALGFSHIETFIASGNVIFESPLTDTPKLEKEIANHLQQSLGYEVVTFIRSRAEMQTIARYEPFPTAELYDPGNSLYIAFLATQPPPEAQQKLITFGTAADAFHIHEREVYWLCHKKMSESTFSGAILEKALGMPATLRNVTTVKKLAAKYPADSNRSQ